MAEATAAVVRVVLGKLADVLVNKARELVDVSEQIKQMQKELLLIQALLRDADSKSNRKELVTEWLNQVREIANTIATVIDTFQVKIEENCPESSNCFQKMTMVVKINYKTYKHGLRKELEGITGELNRILQRGIQLGIQDKLDALDDVDDLEPSDKFDGSISRRTVLSILGIGCLSKITLVRKVHKRIKRAKHDPDMLTGAMRSLPGMPREFDFKELKKATDNFDEKMKLGQGGFGVVYKGVLVGDNGEGDMVVAVKQFSRANTPRLGDFFQELSIINRLRHKHLVRLVGWCHRNCKLLLVYDFMPNGSLDQHLYGGPDKPILTWDQRYNIVTGVASALQYLHNEYYQMVVHRDLKASNVMLDAAFNACLGGFDLAIALETDQTYAEPDVLAGTIGYIAPECFHTGKASRESDVYGFGLTILETVCGRRPSCIDAELFLVDWVWKLYQEGHILEAVDSRLASTFNEADADRLLRLGLMCSHPIPSERPKTQAIVHILQRLVPPPEVPPFKSPFVIPAPQPESDSEPEFDSE